MIRVAESTMKTDTGRQRRENEDSAYARAPLFVVADGMGGAQAGEVASQIAIEVFEQGLPDSGNAEERLAQRVREANTKIHERSLAEHGREGMGTTITAIWLEDSEVSIAHVGDSRAYLFRDGELRRLTQDHTLVDELVRRGKLTEEQAAEHPQRSIITRALGPEPDVEVDTTTYAVKAADVLLLCSDGLTGMVSEERLTEILASAPSLDSAASQLIDEANEAGGRDNITVVAARLEEVDREVPPEEATMIAPPAERPVPSSESGGGGGGPAAAVVAPAPRTHHPLPAPPVTHTRRGRIRIRTKPVAIMISVVIVLLLVGAGGYLASRQLYWIGTDKQGIVTINRGFPYHVPLVGWPLFETYFVSGVPASLVPRNRRAAIFDHRLRSQSDAAKLVRDLELGRVSK